MKEYYSIIPELSEEIRVSHENDDVREAALVNLWNVGGCMGWSRKIKTSFWFALWNWMMLVRMAKCNQDTFDRLKRIYETSNRGTS